MNILNPLLRLYPRAWRARYEEEFTALLEQNRLSLIDIGDIAFGALDAHLRPQVSAAQVRSERRPPVNRATFIRWSGMAGMLGTVLTLAGFVAASIAANDDLVYYFDAVDTALISATLTGVALVLVFAVGSALSHARRVGGVGQAGLLVMFVGLVALGAGIAIHLMESIRHSQIDGWWDYFIYGLGGTCVGGALYALAGTIQRSLPAAGSRLAVIGGFGTVILVALGSGLLGDVTGTTQEVMGWAFLVLTVSFFSGIFLLGYGLWARRESAPAQMEPAALT